MSGYPKRIEMKIRWPPNTFKLMCERCARGRRKTSDLDRRVRRQKGISERITFMPTFALYALYSLLR